MFNKIAMKRYELVLKILARHNRDCRITKSGTNVNSAGFI